MSQDKQHRPAINTIVVGVVVHGIMIESAAGTKCQCLIHSERLACGAIDL